MTDKIKTYGICEETGRRGYDASSSEYLDKTELVLYKGKWVHPLTKIELEDQAYDLKERRRFAKNKELLAKMGFRP